MSEVRHGQIPGRAFRPIIRSGVWDRARRHMNSARFKTLLIILFVLSLALAAIVFWSVYAIGVVRKQSFLAESANISVLAEQIDSELKSVDSVLLLAGQEYRGFALSEIPRKGMEEYAFKEAVKDKLSKVVPALPKLGGVFVSPKNGEFLISMTSAKDGYLQERLVIGRIERYISGGGIERFANAWGAAAFGNGEYFLRALDFGEFYVGGWINAEDILQGLNTKNMIGLKHLYFVSESGTAITENTAILKSGAEIRLGAEKPYLTGAGNQYMAVSHALEPGNVALAALILDSSVLEGLKAFQLFIGLFACVIVFLLAVVLLFMIKEFVSPIRQLVSGMNAIRAGDFDVKLSLRNVSEEYLAVRDTFNSMTSEIKNLKIGIYEETISRQKAQMQFLQLQVNPHFFLNSLNIIYNLASLRDLDTIQKTALFLSRYYRYILYSSDQITVGSELEHIKNYLSIQEIRYSKKLTVDIMAPENVLEIPVPKLIIHTFVENAVKYTVGLDSEIRISVLCNLEKTRGKQRLRIVISDSGGGFSERALEKICRSEQFEDENGRHVGIYNMQKRLELTYGADAQLSFSNASPHGAVVQIMLPSGTDRDGKRREI